MERKNGNKRYRDGFLRCKEGERINGGRNIQRSKKTEGLRYQR